MPRILFDGNSLTRGYGAPTDADTYPAQVVAALSTNAPNLLTDEQASFEGGTLTGWGSPANATIANDATGGSHGTHRMSVTAVAAGDMYIGTTADPAVTAGLVYSAMCDVGTAVTARNCELQMNWRNGAGATISQTLSPQVADVVGGWATLRATGTAPAGAVTVRPVLRVVGAGAAGEIHYLDKVSVSQGPAGPWRLPSATVGLPVVTYTALNLGVNGQSSLQMAADAPAEIDALFNPPETSILVAWSLTGDMGYNYLSAAAGIANFRAYCAARKAQGWTVLILSVLPIDQVAYPLFGPQRAQANATMRAAFPNATAYPRVFAAGDKAWADLFVDIAANPNIGDDGDELNTTYYNTDKVHLTAAGNTEVAGDVANAVRALADLPRAVTTTTPDCVVEWSPSAPAHAAEATISDWTPMVGGIRNLSYHRGFERRPGRVEAGELDLEMGDPTRSYDPTNPDSPWYQIFTARRPIRVRLTVGITTYTAWRGFITDILPDWELGDMWVAVKATDNLALLAGRFPHQSVLGLEIAALSPPPAVWFPLDEGAGSIMHDPLHPTVGGTYNGAIFDSVNMLPFGPAVGLKFQGYDYIKATSSFGISAKRTWPTTFHAWGLVKVPSTSPQAVIWSWSDIVAGIYVELRTNPAGTLMAHYLSQWPTSAQRISRATGPTVTTDRVYMVELVYTSGGQIKLWVDGFAYNGANVTVSPDPVFGTCAPYSTPYGHFGQTTSMGLAAGWSTTGSEAFMAHVFVVDRVLTTYEQATLQWAVLFPWTNDRTGFRVSRILAAMGIAGADQVVDAGTEIMGPEPLADHAIDVCSRIAATDGGLIFVSGPGVFTFQARNHEGRFKGVYDTAPEGTTHAGLMDFTVTHDDTTYYTEATTKVSAPQPIDVTYRHPNATDHGVVSFSDETGFATTPAAMGRAVAIVGDGMPRNEIVSASSRFGAPGVDGLALVTEEIGDVIDVIAHPPDGVVVSAAVGGLWASTFVWGSGLGWDGPHPAMLWGSTLIWGSPTNGWAGPMNPIRQRVRILKISHHLDGREHTFDSIRSTQELRA